MRCVEHFFEGFSALLDQDVQRFDRPCEGPSLNLLAVVVSDAEKPCGKLGLALKPVQRSEGFDKGFLGGVFRFRWIGKEGEAETINPLMMTAYQFRIRFTVSTQNIVNYLYVVNGECPLPTCPFCNVIKILQSPGKLYNSRKGSRF